MALPDVHYTEAVPCLRSLNPIRPELRTRESMQRPGLVAITHHRPATGLTRVMQSVLSGLRQWFSIHYVGIGYKGPVIEERGLTLYPCNRHGGDVYGAYQARTLIEQHRPAFVLLLNDLWILHNYAFLAACRPRPCILAYVPLDGHVRDVAWMEPLHFIDQWVVYTRFAKREVETAGAQLSERHEQWRAPAIAVIPHGVDTTVFYPLDRRSELKRRVFPAIADPGRSFVVLNANRPQPRKRIDLTIAGFARFAADKPSTVYLCLHHAVRSEQERRQILAWAEQYGIRRRLIMSPDETGLDADDAALNLLYNACDLGLSTSMGEGWGLVSFEHAATGAAQILPHHSACAELWQDRAILVAPVTWRVPSFSPLEMAEVSAQRIADALESLYVDPHRRARLAVAGHHLATQPCYRWSTVSAQWHALLSRNSPC